MLRREIPFFVCFFSEENRLFSVPEPPRRGSMRGLIPAINSSPWSAFQGGPAGGIHHARLCAWRGPVRRLPVQGLPPTIGSLPASQRPNATEGDECQQGAGFGG